MYAAAAVAFSLIASAVKIAGGVLFGSRALFVDALTCVANAVAVLGTVYYYRASLHPPDEDHHYGHYRIGFTGVLVTLVAYSFVAGLSVARLAAFESYTVSIYAPATATAGFVLYLASVLASRKVGGFFAPYALFTVSELMESTVVIASSLAGALYSFLIDYAGAVAITAYIFYEVYETLRDVSVRISDVAPPPELLDVLYKELEGAGFLVKRARVRLVSEGVYHGDVVVVADPSISIREVHERLEKVEESLRKHGLDVSIHVEPR